MAAAITNKPTMTNNPTRSSVHESCLRCAILDPPQRSSLLLAAGAISFGRCEKLFQIFILGCQQSVRGVLEINLSFAEDEDVCYCLCAAVAVFRERLDAACIGVEAVIREAEGILQAMR